MLKQITSVLKITTLALVLSFGLSYALAWTAPTQNPPTGNVPAPINASNTPQEKTGALTLSGGLVIPTGAGAAKVLTSDASGNATWQAASGGLTGGTTNYLAKWTSGTALGVGQIFDNGTSVGVGTSAPTAKFEVVGGDALINGLTVGNGAHGAGNYASSTAVGFGALYSNTTGYSNTAIGASALRNNTTGYRNTAIGDDALVTNIGGNTNVAVGYSALKNAKTVSTLVDMSGFGFGPWMTVNDVSVGNVALGGNALYSNTTGDENVAVGMSALLLNTTGIRNIGIGGSSLYNNTTGNQNVAMGEGAAYSNTTGYGNVAIGDQALMATTYGSANIAIGIQTLSSNTIGYYNTALGTNAGPTANNLSNTTALGYGAVPTASNYVRIGNASVTQIGGQVGWSALSDAREKENVADYTHGLDFIMKLRPVTYNMIADKTKVTHSGFIAQEVEKTGIPFYGLNKPANDKDKYSLNYSEFVVPLVNSVKELKKENDQLKADNAALRAEMKATTDTLLARIEALESKAK